MRHGLKMLGISAAVAAGISGSAMAQPYGYACPAGYSLYNGVCQPYGYAPTNPVSGAATGAAAGAATGAAVGGPVGAVVGGAVGTATGAVTGATNEAVGIASGGAVPPPAPAPGYVAPPPPAYGSSVPPPAYYHEPSASYHAEPGYPSSVATEGCPIGWVVWKGYCFPAH